MDADLVAALRSDVRENDEDSEQSDQREDREETDECLSSHMA
jgi:hypothetical protein